MAASKITGGCWPVIKILPPFTTHSNPPTIAASPPKRIRAEVAVTPLSYAFPYEHMISPAQSRRTSLRLIHRSAWKVNSRKFAGQSEGPEFFPGLRPGKTQPPLSALSAGSVRHYAHPIRLKLYVDPGKVIGVIALYEPVIGVCGGPESVPPGGQPRNVNVLIGQVPVVYVAPTDRQPHQRLKVGGRRATRGRRRLARVVGRAAGTVAVVVVKAETMLRPRADELTVVEAYQFEVLEILHVPVIVPVACEVHDRGGGNIPGTASAIEDALLGRHGRSTGSALSVHLEWPRPDIDDY